MPEPIPLRRPWHGASDKPETPAVAALRAQRAEVDALLAFRHAPDGEAKAIAWWRLHALRQARAALLGAEEAARLTALPAPPEGALGPLQKLRLRLGWLDLARARPPAKIAKRLGAA
ncbi:hypothetical protein G3576_18580 [Roseomonas stagni]|uniref:Uncharacterized protein n=1 Tax=Falsiroseomonas algicola TaxID=2716930 RepID=A0A6M1LPA4_9PROT|nr:hypothetical protein [Falsiroseomonas algicola]NGM22037.1 hypothetical protein [Falsiroseomonas algicola]